MKTFQRGLAVLALLCFALPRAEAVTIYSIPFTAVVSKVDNFYDPQRTLHQPEVPPVSVGVQLVGVLNVNLNPLDSRTSYSLLVKGGDYIGADGHSGPYPVGGLLLFQHQTAGQFMGLTLRDPAGGRDWESGTFIASDQWDYPDAWWRFEATLTQIPDGGHSAAMLGIGLVLLGLVVHQRRETPSPCALRCV